MIIMGIMIKTMTKTENKVFPFVLWGVDYFQIIFGLLGL
jgi:hypothetical protein